MVPRSQNHAYSDGGSVLWVDGERVFRRGWGPEGPCPAGHGDWSLLDPVKAPRAKLRRAP
jgi:hypothetical protein